MFKTPLMTEEVVQTDALFTVTEVDMGWTKTNGENWRRIPNSQFRGLVRVKPINNVPIPFVLNVVSGTYKLVQNYELYTHIENIIKDNIIPDRLKNVVINDKSSHHGRVTFREYLFHDIKAKINEKSTVSFRLIIKNVYGGGSLRVIYGAIDTYCINGMITGEYEANYFRHTSGLEIPMIGKSIGPALDKFVEETDRMRTWARTYVGHDEAMKLFKRIAASPRMIEKMNSEWMREADDRGQTKWALYSTLTNYSSSQDGTFKIKQTEHDTVQATLHARELNVHKWITLPEFVLAGES